MGVRVFEIILPPINRHPRGVLIEDPDLSEVDSRPDISGMTVSNTSILTTKSPNLSTAPSLLESSAGMKGNIHVLPSG